MIHSDIKIENFAVVHIEETYQVKLNKADFVKKYNSEKQTIRPYKTVGVNDNPHYIYNEYGNEYIHLDTDDIGFNNVLE